MPILEILCCDPKGRRALLRVPFTKGRSVCLCWAKSNPKGPKTKGPEGPNGPKSTTLATLAASHLHWRAESLRSLTATQKEAGVFCRSFLPVGEVLAYVGRIQTMNEIDRAGSSPLLGVLKTQMRKNGWHPSIPCTALTDLRVCPVLTMRV